MQKRPLKDKYYLSVAREIAKRSTCLRVRSGAVIVKDNAIIATGYCGAPRKTKDCFERNECLRDRLNIPHGYRYELCRSVHSEQNAIVNAARLGTNVSEGDMFLYGEGKERNRIDFFPCFICKKMIINAGLNRIICSTSDGEYKVFNVQDWVRNWQERDIIDDKHQYGVD